MIRYTFIKNQSLKVFKLLPKISFPLDIETVIKYLPRCGFISYQDFAKANGCTLEEVIAFCESTSGCTHYDIAKNRYLIMCNKSPAKNNNSGRQRWTGAHEIGHIACKHHLIGQNISIAENNFTNCNSNFEAEADYFAACLLAPLPLFQILNVKSPIDVENIFGLSTTASIYRFKEYLRWKQFKVKSAWENDMMNLYKQKGI